MSYKLTRRPLVLAAGAILMFWISVVWFGPRTSGIGALLYRQTEREALLKTKDKAVLFSCEVRSVERKARGQWIRAKKDDVYVEGYVPEEKKVSAGDILRIYAGLTLPEPGSNPGQFDAQTYYALRKTDYLMNVYSCEITGHRITPASVLSGWRTALSDNLFSVLPEEEAGVASAIVLGTSDLVDPETRELFREAGISHLLAVSGLHVMSFFNAVSLVLAKLLGNRKGAVGSVLFMWLYVVLTGSSVSSVRAGLMMSFKIAAKLFYREDDPLISYLVPAAWIVCVQPLYLLDSGFWLSFGAMLGMRFLNPVLQRLSPVPFILRKLFAASLSVLLFTTPISLYFYFEFNPYGILINPIVIPFMTYVYVLSASGALVCFISPVLGRFAVGLVYFIIRAYIEASKWINALPGASLLLGRPEWWQLLGYYVLLFGLMALSYQKKEALRRFWYVWAFCGTVSVLMLFPYRRDRVIFLNVGQGDCAVIECQKRVYLVDAGPGYAQVIKPYLRSRGIHKIDGIFLSHPDNDHMAGVKSLLTDKDFTVRTLYAGDTRYTDKEAYQSLLRSAGHFVMLVAGQKVTAGDLSFLCLSPAPDKNYENDNDASMVLLFQTKDFSVYFTGDIEESGERALLPFIPESTGTVVLKVSHHGSRTSTSAEFLERIGADRAVISAKKSVYGHPHEETLSRLQEHGILWYITEYTGAVWLTRKGLKCYN